MTNTIVDIPDSRVHDLVSGYFSEFDSNQRAMAASPESILYCLDVIKETGATNVLDAGSGLSSIFFHDLLDNVRTVDSDPGWSQKTSELISKILHKNVSISTIDEVKDESFDFVFYDYGDIETRIYNFKKALSMTRRYMYIDDMHIDFYHGYIKSRAKPYPFEIVSETKDEFGRFGALLQKS